MTTPAETLAKKLNCRGKVRKVPVFDSAVRGLREQLNLSISEVADAIGISKAALWQIEHGRDLLLSTALKLSRFFGKPIQSIWDEHTP